MPFPHAKMLSLILLSFSIFKTQELCMSVREPLLSPASAAGEAIAVSVESSHGDAACEVAAPESSGFRLGSPILTRAGRFATNIA